jgi:hypothetical protein
MELAAVPIAARRDGLLAAWRVRTLAAIALTALALAGCQSASVALNPNSMRSLSWFQTLTGTCSSDLPVAVVVVDAAGVMVGSAVVTHGTSPDPATQAPSGSPGACRINTVMPVSQASTRYWVGVTLHTTVLIVPPNGGGGLGSVYGPFTSLRGVLTPPRGQ